jgi:hypothetical protein
MMNSNMKKNRKKIEERYASILNDLHAPYLCEAAVCLPVDVHSHVLKTLAHNGDSWAVLCTGGAPENHVSQLPHYSMQSPSE